MTEMATTAKFRFGALSRIVRSGRDLLQRLRADRRGNVMMITGLMIVPLTVSVGFGVDYAKALRMQTKLNAAADAAALAAVAAVNMQVYSQTGSTAGAVTAATNMFKSQVTGLPGLVFNAATDLTVTPTTSGGLNGGLNVQVTYKAQSTNSFSGILGSPSLPITGTAVAYSAAAPNINFYLTMDSSPSMLLPSSSTGLTNIYADTGCNFACHEQNPRSDNINVRDTSGRDIFLNGNYYGTGTGSRTWYALKTSNKTLYDSTGAQIGTNSTISNNVLTYYIGSTKYTVAGYYADGYWLTHNYPLIHPGADSIDLRVLDETNAAKLLIPYAQGKAVDNNVTYKMQFFSFDWTHSGNTTPVKTYGTMTDIASLSASNVPDIDGTQDYWVSNGVPFTGQNIDDQASEFYNMLVAMGNIIPTPGANAGNSSSNPQNVLFLITDGMSDENVGGRTHSPMNTATLAKCTALKNRGIQIAILYTTYLPNSMQGDSWSQTNVLPYVSPTDQVLTALNSCASTAKGGTPLVYQVSTDQSISVALQALFSLVVMNAHLVR